MNANQFLIYDQPSSQTTSFKVGNAVVPAPAYIPEIKGIEDLIALLNFSSVIPKGNPIMVPAYRWLNLISDPRIRQQNILSGNDLIGRFLADHPIYFYDPPEFYKYSLGSELVRYALKGEGMSTFERRLKEGKMDAALDPIPEFFKPFIQRQMEGIQHKLEIGNESPEKSRPHVERAWLDSEIDEAYVPYIYRVVAEALKMPSAVLIPPVPPLVPSSDDSYVSRVISSNRAASIACADLSKKSKSGFGNQGHVIYPYFHLYLDWSIAEHRSRGINVERIGDLLEEELDNGSFAGVAITIIGYENAAKSHKFKKIDDLMTDIVNICSQCYLPVILPRSEWFGLALTDIQIQGFGSLLNGKIRYMPKGGGGRNPDDQYGKTPLIEGCYELKKSEIVEYINENGELPFVPGLPRKPSLEDLENPDLYRKRFSKPMRLIHIEEARRIRNDKSKGRIEPAKLYFSRSEHNYLKGDYI